ncbi:MAG: DNA alkylation repair protein [Bacilli bacterium]|nr:DNA alkylation repair protein [Bacilli bacterium]
MQDKNNKLASFDLNKDNWQKCDYEKYINYLISLSDNKLKRFSEGLIFSNYEILGIKLPVLRLIAKEISKGNIVSFLKIQKNNFFESVMIEGFVISHISDEQLFDRYFYNFIDKIDNWSLCDSFCNSLKKLKNKDKYFKVFKDLTKSKKEYHVRVGLIGILSCYVNDKHIEEIFKILDSIKLDTYYVNMACAWLLCECTIKQREKTLKYFKVSKLNTFTYNKAISKCNDSLRVNKEDKNYLKSLKK